MVGFFTKVKQRPPPLVPGWVTAMPDYVNKTKTKQQQQQLQQNVKRYIWWQQWDETWQHDHLRTLVAGTGVPGSIAKAPSSGLQ